MDNIEKFAEIIELIYATVDKPDTWNQILPAMSDYSHSTHSFFTERRGVHGEPVSFYDAGFSDQYFHRYGDYYYRVDVWSQNLAKFKPNEFHASHTVCDDNQFLESEIYNDFARPEQIRHSIGLFLGDPYSDMTTEMAFMRSKGQPHYDAPTVSAINRFIPHIQQVQQLNRRLFKLELRNQQIEQLVDALDEAIFLCDSHLNIQFCNRPAQKLAQHTRLLSPQQEFFKLREKAYQETLIHIIKDACIVYETKTRFVKRHMLLLDKDKPYLLTITPWNRTNVLVFGEHPIFGVKLSILPINGRALPTKYDLATMFELTLTEAEIVRLLCCGHSIESIAIQRNTAIQTTRQQVKQCLVKTQTNRQVELVIKVLSRCLV